MKQNYATASAAGPASGSALVPAITGKHRRGPSFVKQVSNEKPFEVVDEPIMSDRVYDEALSSGSRLSADPSPDHQQQKANLADTDLIGGLEMLSPSKKEKQAEIVSSQIELQEYGSTQRKKRRIETVDVNKDMAVQRDENLMMDLLGFGTNETGENCQSAAGDNSCMEFTKTTPEILLLQVVEQTLKAYSVDEKLPPLEVLNLLDKREINRLQKELIEPIIKNQPPQQWSQNILDLGDYPMNTWMNNEIIFVSQVEEIQQGSVFLEGTYDLKQKEDGTTVKIFQQSFDAPDDSDRCHVVRFTDCSTQLDLRHWEFEQTDFLVFNQITADEMIGFVALLNQRIVEPRTTQVKQTKLILGYVIIGILFMALLITLIAVFLTAWVSAIAVIIYFVGLFILMKRTGLVQVAMEKSVFFNLAIAIHNLNKSCLESQFQLRCRLGHLGQWIEFHSLRRKTSDEEQNSEQHNLLNNKNSDELQQEHPNGMPPPPKRTEKQQRVTPIGGDQLIHQLGVE